MKFVLVLLAACMAFQTISATPTIKSTVDYVGIVKEVLKVAVDVSEKLLEGVDNFFTSYTSNVAEENKKVVEIVEKIADTITNVIVYEVGQLLDVMEPTAAENGKKAITCIRKEKVHVTTAVRGSVDAITEGILATVPTLVKDGSDLMDVVKATLAIVKTAEEKLEKCTLGELCLIQLLSDLAGVTKEGNDLLKGISELVEGFKAAIPAWFESFKSENVNIVKNIVDIFDEGITCIDS